jgi:hypothetical protein
MLLNILLAPFREVFVDLTDVFSQFKYLEICTTLKTVKSAWRDNRYAKHIVELLKVRISCHRHKSPVPN